MMVDPRSREHRRRRAATLDPGAKVAPRRAEHGDEAAVTVRAILARQRRKPVEPEPVETDDAWAEAARRAGLIENGHGEIVEGRLMGDHVDGTSPDRG